MLWSLLVLHLFLRWLLQFLCDGVGGVGVRFGLVLFFLCLMLVLPLVLLVLYVVLMSLQDVGFMMCLCSANCLFL